MSGLVIQQRFASRLGNSGESGYKGKNERKRVWVGVRRFLPEMPVERKTNSVGRSDEKEEKETRRKEGRELATLATVLGRIDLELLMFDSGEDKSRITRSRDPLKSPRICQTIRSVFRSYSIARQFIRRVRFSFHFLFANSFSAIQGNGERRVKNC